MKKRKKPKTKKLPNLNYLLENYEYDPLTGILYERDYDIRGKRVGYQDKRGYWHVQILKTTYKLHRIVFYMFHRRDPGKKVIDHIDGDKGNNAIVNLRAVSQRVNAGNTDSARETKPRPANEPGAWKLWAMPVS